MIDPQTRRTFLRAVAATGVTWAAADILDIEEALGWASHRRGADVQVFTVLSPAQARDVEAIAMRIMPNDDGTPGAREAGVIHFIDRSLATFAAGQKPVYEQGVREINERVAAKHAGVARFAELQPAQQDDLLREIERTPFFNRVRVDTLVGMFALPSYGGNKDYIGWSVIGHEHRPLFQPPFGYYDAAANGGR